MYKRVLATSIRSGHKSILLLGPRQTGKSTLIKSLKPDLEINLVKETVFTEFLRDPEELENRLAHGNPKTVFIDEIQRIPSLLNTIQSIVDEDRGIRFFLTGSSARKLRRGSANLLPGRIHAYRIGGLTADELGGDFVLKKALKVGTLPGVYLETQTSALKTLRSYTHTYLREEIQAEALTKNLEGFVRFLSVVCSYYCKHIDYSKISKQAQVSRSSVIRYTEILEDTLVAELVYPYQGQIHRRLVQHPKIYFFDSGVLNSLVDNFSVSAERVGLVFENFVYSQLRSAAYAKDVEMQLFSYRTEHGAEVDFIVKIANELTAVEVKATKSISKIDLRGFKSFEEVYGKKVRKMIVYMGDVDKKISDVLILSLQSAIRELGL